MVNKSKEGLIGLGFEHPNAMSKVNDHVFLF